MVASAGENDSDLARTQLAQKLGVYNIIEFKHYNFKTLQYLYNFIIFIIFYSFKLHYIKLKFKNISLKKYAGRFAWARYH
jgi:hypothetical protein